MRNLLAVSLVLCLAASATGQWIISEVHTGTPDFVEIQNISPGPLDPVGLSIYTSNNAVCPAVDAANNGAYTILNPLGTVVLPGGFYVIEDLGIAGGAPAVIQPSTGLPVVAGEHTGKNISWAGGSHGEVALYDAGGAALDYMQFLYTLAGGVGGAAANPPAEGFRNNPPDTFWLSGPIARIAGLDAIWRINPGAGDNDLNTDWDCDVTANITPGDPNPGVSIGANGPQALTPGCDLAVTNAPVFDILVITGSPLVAGPTSIYNLISLQQVCNSEGVIFGLAVDVLGELLSPQGTVPFHDTITGGGYQYNLPFAAPPGLTLTIRSIVVETGAGVTARPSNFVYLNT